MKMLWEWTSHWANFIVILLFFAPAMLGQDFEEEKYVEVNCSELRMGQFLCNITSNIDPATQQPRGCTRDNVAKIPCIAVDGLRCQETGNRTFEKEIPCKWTNGYSYSTTLLLSVFFGILGVDRLYLGHIGMGALKFCTLGFLFIGQLVDIILIATQNIQPKDGSNYVVGYYGPGVETIRANNLTYIVPRIDWYTDKVKE